MTRAELKELRQLAKKFRQLHLEADKWITENFHRCGHSNTDDALGDEGWMKAHKFGGKSVAYFDAASQLDALLDNLRQKSLKYLTKDY